MVSNALYRPIPPCEFEVEVIALKNDALFHNITARELPFTLTSKNADERVHALLNTNFAVLEQEKVDFIEHHVPHDGCRPCHPLL
jgi:hypothetical protein